MGCTVIHQLAAHSPIWAINIQHAIKVVRLFDHQVVCLTLRLVLEAVHLYILAGGLTNAYYTEPIAEQLQGVYHTNMDIQFSKIIKDLRAAGWYNSEIAAKVDCSAVYIGQLANGNRKEPGYNLGRKLVLLHQRET